MMDVLSFYPHAVDEMFFFQDNNIDNMETINTYNSLIAQGRYLEAGNLISRHEEVFGLYAHYLNAIENRIYNLQEYLLTKERKNRYIFSDVEPVFAAEGTIWI